jgi:uncharacterized membrane protein SpoIIM required for sporulation
MLFLQIAMRESKFIDRNSEKWKQFEDKMRTQNMSPDQLEKAFLELNDDLAYSRTYFPNRTVRVFLNNLLTPVYDRIYRSRPLSVKVIKTFFTDTAPRIHWSARRFIMISFITVMLGFLIGFFGTQHNKSFAVTVLGSSYVSMTEENIEKGDPLGVYKSDSPGEMFLHIATNNLRVGFYFFVFGALFCVGSMYLLLINGIILGVFTYMFTSRGLTGEYLLTVYQHGTLEILSMIIEGAAGIMLGAGILFPGTLPRTQSIQNAARKSITMFLVCLPIIIIAAFIESFLTRFTEIGTLPRTMIILLSLGFMLYYFLILPWWKFKGNKQFDIQEDQPHQETERKFQAGKIYSIGMLLVMGIHQLRQSFGRWFMISLCLGMGGYYMAVWLGGQDINRDIAFQFRRWMYSFSQSSPDTFIELYFGSAKIILWNIYACRYVFFAARFPEVLPALFAIWYLVCSVLTNIAWKRKGESPTRIQKWIKPGIAAMFISFMLWLAQDYWFPFLWLIWPLLSMGIGLGIHVFDGNVFAGILKAFSLARKQFGRFLGSMLLVTVLYVMLMLGLWFFTTTVLNFSSPMQNFNPYSKEVLTFYVLLNFVLWPVILTAAGYFYMNSGMVMHEKQDGGGLLERINNIGFKREVYGVETE